MRPSVPQTGAKILVHSSSQEEEGTGAGVWDSVKVADIYGVVVSKCYSGNGIGAIPLPIFTVCLC